MLLAFALMFLTIAVINLIWRIRDLEEKVLRLDHESFVRQCKSRAAYTSRVGETIKTGKNDKK